MQSNYKDLLSIVRLGIGHNADSISDTVDWKKIKALAVKQGLDAIVLDGIEKLKISKRPKQTTLLEWIGEVLQVYEYRYEEYKRTLAEMAGFYNSHGVKMMVLKGYVCSLNWPKPEHRPCGDIDIWLFGKQKEADTVLTHEKRIEVDTSEHHHTTFFWGDFMVENHYDFINTHRHYSHRGLEQIFKELGQDDSYYVEVKSASAGSATRVYLPSPNLHSLFLIRHALNHFTSIGINLRQVLDWAFFVEKHTNEIDWKWLEAVIDEYHMKDFYNCINAICVDDLGFNSSIFPSVQFMPSLKEKVLDDILDPEFTIEEPDGLLCRWIHKYRRWRGNRWKQKLCYKENLWCSIWGGLMVHLLKPKGY